MRHADDGWGENASYLRGPTEVDMVRSGLEEIIRHTLARIVDDMTRNGGTFRSAAYRIAIAQVA